MSSLEMELNLPGMGRFTVAASGTTYVERGEPYYDPQLGVMRTNTEIVDANMRASSRELGDIDILVGTCHGLEPSCGVILEMPGRQDSVWSAFGIRPKVLFDSPPPFFRDGTSSAGACLEGDSIIMLSVIPAIPPCGFIYTPPKPYRVEFLDCCTGEVSIAWGTLTHVGHIVCADPTLPSPPPPRDVNLEVNIIDVLPDSGATAGYTQLKLINRSNCNDVLIDSGPVTLDGGESPRETAYLLAVALNDSASVHPNCDCEIDTVGVGEREGLVNINCRITFGNLGVCLVGTDQSPPGQLLSGQSIINRNQNYGNVILEEDYECFPRELDDVCDFGWFPAEAPEHLVEAWEIPPPPATLEVMPNPVGPSAATIQFMIQTGSELTLEVYDSTGRRVGGITRGWTPPGQHSIEWNGLTSDGRTVSPGIYWFRLRSADGDQVGKAVVLR
jgi:hypothetical protein